MTETNFKKHIQSRLNALVGLKLSILRDALNMKMFHFGDINPSPSGKGSVGTYALHVQCPWRIVSENMILTGSSDRNEPPQDNEEADEEDKRSGTLQRARLFQIMQGYDEATRSIVNSTNAFAVLSIKVDEFGGLDLSLSGAYNLQLFPSGASGEDWRFFNTGGASHLVVEAGRAEEVE